MERKEDDSKIVNATNEGVINNGSVNVRDTGILRTTIDTIKASRKRFAKQD